MGRGVLPLYEVDVIDGLTNRPVRSYVIRARDEMSARRIARDRGYIAPWQRAVARPSMTLFPAAVGRG